MTVNQMERQADREKETVEGDAGTGRKRTGESERQRDANHESEETGTT